MFNCGQAVLTLSQGIFTVPCPGSEQGHEELGGAWLDCPDLAKGMFHMLRALTGGATD